MGRIAIIVYGNAGELGNFKVFADNLHKDLSKKYKKVILKYINRDTGFLKLINSVSSNDKIAELHIFAHSIGAGIFFGYGDISVDASRENTFLTARSAGRRVTYNEAVGTEVGALQTDDLKTGAFLKQRLGLQSKFSADAFIKIWGCNSGVENYIYSDSGAVDPNDTSADYYWRAFNEFNKPKPSIAKALAKYFNCKVYGAKSGANIEVKYNKRWISSQQFRKNIGHWPSSVLPHRLTPEKGAYYEFLP